MKGKIYLQFWLKRKEENSMKHRNVDFVKEVLKKNLNRENLKFLLVPLMQQDIEGLRMLKILVNESREEKTLSFNEN